MSCLQHRWTHLDPARLVCADCGVHATIHVELPAAPRPKARRVESALLDETTLAALCRLVESIGSAKAARKLRVSAAALCAALVGEVVPPAVRAKIEEGVA